MTEKTLAIRLYPVTDQHLQLRLLDGESLLGERSLAVAAVDALLATVAKHYHQYGDLQTLGDELYRWLDGPTERWLSDARGRHRHLCLHIDVDARLRHLPWELLFDNGQFLCTSAQGFTVPVRRVGEFQSPVSDPANRPLRVLFMATSPEGVVPVLDFETEEGLILDATRQQPIELLVEESGSLTGLKDQISSREAGHFDVFHLTGHGDIHQDTPVFVMEDEQGFPKLISAPELADAFGQRWPRLVFLSGCRTGESVDQGSLPSFCEALVEAGASAVLGWALPVGDRAASEAAAALYRQLATGESIPTAVAAARRGLFEHPSGASPYWHLLRLYGDCTPLSALVTPLRTVGRQPVATRAAQTEILDPEGQVKVCGRGEFVGRRRLLQRCLRVLRSFPGEDNYHLGVLLTGMGGLGKSSLAARLCDRLPEHRRLVWVGWVDEVGFLATLSDRIEIPDAQKILKEADLTLVQRLRRLFREPLASLPHLFIFDDFEHSLEGWRDGETGAPRLRTETLPVFQALLGALHDTGSSSRLIVTSRYEFAAPGPGHLHHEGLESLRGADLEKKTRQLNRLADRVDTDKLLRERAIGLAEGNPRLLEWLNQALEDTSADREALLAKLADTEVRFREDVLLEALLDRLPAVKGRMLLALLGVFELPVPMAAVVAVVGDEITNFEPVLGQAVELGLVEKGRENRTGESLYFVSGLVDTLLAGELNETEVRDACHRGAEALHQLWWTASGGSSEVQMLEIHRLAIGGGHFVVGEEMAEILATRWTNAARYRDAERLCRETLALGETYRLLHTAARAEKVLGKTEAARQHYEKAIEIVPPVDENFDPTTIYEVSGLYYNYAELVAQQGDVNRALQLWQESLKLLEQIDDVQGKAATLHQMAGVIAQQGDVNRALQLWQESLKLYEQIGDVKGKAATLANMAWLAYRQDDMEKAREYYLEAARSLSAVHAWLDLSTVLWNLGMLGENGQAGNPAYLAQAFWLCLVTGVPLQKSILRTPKV